MDPQNQNQLDPQVVNLTKAIRQVESGGNFQAKGKSGEYGAYQFMPGTWASSSQKYLGQSIPLDQATPEQQNEVAYKKIKDLKDQGLNVGQIASDWNSGDPNTYLDPEAKGTNSAGANYDVPAYAEKVANTYQGLKGQSAGAQGTNQTDATKKPGFLDNLKASFTQAVSNEIGYVGEGLGIVSPALPVAGGVAGFVSGGPAGAIVGYEAGKEGQNLINSAIKSPTSTNMAGNPISGGAGGTGGTSGGSNNSQPNVANELINLGDENSKTNNASKVLADAQIDSMNTTQSNRQLLQDPNTQAGIRTNAIFGFGPEVDENGNQDWSHSLQKSKGMVADLSKKAEEVLNAEGSTGNFSNVSTRAKEILHERLPEYEWAEADKHIDQAVASYSKRYSDKGGNAPTSIFQRMKQDTGHGKKWGLMDTTTKKEAFKSVSRASREEIVKNTKNKELYNSVMKMEQNLINGQNIMKRLNGKKGLKVEGLTKGLLHSAGRYAAVYIGDKIGGPIGAILGDMVGIHITKKIDRKFGKTVFETPAMKKALIILGAEEPKAYQVLRAKLQESGIAVPEEEKAASSLPELLKSKDPSIGFNEGTKLDTTLEKLHKEATSGKPKKSQKQSK
jgi:hypothetical protein